VRITIETDEVRATTDPAPPPSSQSPGDTTGPHAAAYDDASAAELARRTGATNAGPAPTSPDALGDPSDLPTSSAAESGGPAPGVQG
jgi:hypothetical protein